MFELFNMYALIVMVLLYITSIVFYISQYPESKYPGKFDIIVTYWYSHR